MWKHTGNGTEVLDRITPCASPFALWEKNYYISPIDTAVPMLLGFLLVLRWCLGDWFVPVRTASKIGLNGRVF